MGRIVERVRELAEPLAAERGLELWDVEYVKEAGQWFLRVNIDKRSGAVGIDDCEAFSRAFDPILDAADPIEGSYVFEVSSAGAERVLKRPSDFARFLGETVEVKLYQPKNGSRVHTGVLRAYEGGDVTIETGGGETTFPRDGVAQVRLRII